MLRRTYFSLASSSKSKSKTAAADAAADLVPASAIYKKTSHPRIFTVDAITSPEKPYRGVAALMGWLFGKPKAVSKYATIYAENGFDTVMVTGDWKDIMMPEKSAKLMEAFEQEINASHLKRAVAENNLNMERRVVLHGLSMGSYQTAMWLRGLRQCPHGHTVNSIKCQIYDSFVDHEYGAIGISKASSSNPVVAGAVSASITAALNMFPAVKKEHLACSDRMRNHPINAPALFFYSAEDLVSPEFISEGIMEGWKKKGMDVQGVSFSQTTHVSHMKHYPEKYRASMETFLDKHMPATKKEVKK